MAKCRPIAVRAAAALWCAWVGVAAATTATTTFQVTATVSANCIVSATALSFGTYDPLSASATTSTSTITVRCTLDTPYTVALDAGTGSGATVSARKMSKGADTLSYSLYQDGSYLSVWGQTAGTDTLGGTGTGSDIEHTVHGRIPAGQNVRTGAYADTITVSVDY
jgi:spore coat protein U-like protein